MSHIESKKSKIKTQQDESLMKCKSNKSRFSLCWCHMECKNKKRKIPQGNVLMNCKLVIKFKAYANYQIFSYMSFDFRTKLSEGLQEVV